MKVVSEKPYAMVGAGMLVASLWKNSNQEDDESYGFNLYRLDAETGAVSQKLGPGDILALVKLARVLSQVIVDDGCLSQSRRSELESLADQIDSVLGTGE